MREIVCSAAITLFLLIPRLSLADCIRLEGSAARQWGAEGCMQCDGVVTCPRPEQRSSCSPGWVLSSDGRHCRPIGSVDCGPGRGYCDAGYDCGKVSGCIPHGKIDCGTFMCDARERCGSRTCLSPGETECPAGGSCKQGSYCSKNGRHCFRYGTIDCGDFSCSQEQVCGSRACLPAGAVECGSTYCTQGEACVGGRTCDREDFIIADRLLQTGRYWEALRNYRELRRTGPDAERAARGEDQAIDDIVRPIAAEALRALAEKRFDGVSERISEASLRDPAIMSRANRKIEDSLRREVSHAINDRRFDAATQIFHQATYIGSDLAAKMNGFDSDAYRDYLQKQAVSVGTSIRSLFWAKDFPWIESIPMRRDVLTRLKSAAKATEAETVRWSLADVRDTTDYILETYRLPPITAAWDVIERKRSFEKQLKEDVHNIFYNLALTSAVTCGVNSTHCSDVEQAQQRIFQDIAPEIHRRPLVDPYTHFRPMDVFKSQPGWGSEP